MEAVIGTILKDPPKEGQGVQWALTVAVLLLAVLIGWMIRKLDKNATADAERTKEFRAALSEHQKETDERFSEHSERMSCIERDYLTRETHYKDIGGWRTDMNNVRDNLGEEIRGVRQDINALIPSLVQIAMQKGASNGD